MKIYFLTKGYNIKCTSFDFRNKKSRLKKSSADRSFKTFIKVKRISKLINKARKGFKGF